MEQQKARMSQGRTPLGGRRAVRGEVRLPRLEEDPDAVGGGAEGGRPGGAGRRPGRRQGGAAGTGTVYRAGGRRVLPALLERLPAARLTGLGCGLLSTLALFVFACLDWLLLDGSPAVYGGFFLLVSLAAALWVRPYDLITPPVTLPIAFTLGTVPISGDGDGVGGLAVGVFSVLALQVGWLYAGTGLSVVLVLLRKSVLVARRRAARLERRRQAEALGRRRPAPAADSANADAPPAPASPSATPPSATPPAETP
ncbi:DUF6542 domain-containing protein [Streptomyces sp. NPDC059740]|uniref:DUF6542 domain-containing protein n=1 Tax=Streptomyces sp. NPDC059740 TaxID=3346926 RepID=UPI00366A03F7